MEYQFNVKQFNEDILAIKEFFVGFMKSFGPSQKKVQEREIGFFEEMHIRFRLHIVEMGISKVIRTCLVLIVGIIVFFAVFIPASSDWRWVVGYLFLLYAIWQFMPDIEKARKAGGGFISEFLFIIYDWTTDLFKPAEKPAKK